MRVLYITSRFPGDMRRGDQLRAFQQLRYLSVRHDITLLSFDRPGATAPLFAELEKYCKRIIVVKLDRVGMLLRAARALPSRIPLQAAMYAAPALRRQMVQQIGTREFDIVHVQLARLGPLLDYTSPVPCVLDLVDALSLNMLRRAQRDRSAMRLFARLESTRLPAYERELSRRAAKVCVSANSDREAIGAQEDKVQVIGNGVDLETFVFDPRPRQAEEVVFTGNLGYFPNVDAALWFTHEVMPRVRMTRPAAVGMLVGARPARELRRAAAAVDGVEMIGPVDKIQPYLARASVAVAPMRAGSGQQIKILEAMAIGTPLVVTRLAASGMQAEDGEHFLVADSADEFAHAVVRLLNDKTLAARLANNARLLVEKHYSWQASATALENVWMNAAQMCAAAPTTAAVP